MKPKSKTIEPDVIVELFVMNYKNYFIILFYVKDNHQLFTECFFKFNLN